MFFFFIHTSSNTPPPFLDILKCFAFPPTSSAPCHFLSTFKIILR
nr:MAG TPA: hypothetical protein [Caudoviricetes sp.]